MVGILLLSHGNLAQGLLDSSKLFFGEDIPRIEAICYDIEDVDTFDWEIDQAINHLDDGSGVLVMCDIYGGTPSNRCAYKLSDKIRVVTGVNLVMLLDALGRRMNAREIDDMDIKHIMESGKKCIVCLIDIYNQQ